MKIRHLEPEVVARLAEQAAAEGLSQQEWLRETLRRTAARLSPAGLVAQRGRLTPMSDAEFARLEQRVAERRAAAGRRRGAGERGR